MDKRLIRKDRSNSVEKLEIANAKGRGQLLPAAKVEKEWASVLRGVRGRCSRSSRVQKKLPHLSAHDVAAIDALGSDLP
jgi:hypothetical protein